MVETATCGAWFSMFVSRSSQCRSACCQRPLPPGKPGFPLRSAGQRSAEKLLPQTLTGSRRSPDLFYGERVGSPTVPLCRISIPAPPWIMGSFHRWRNLGMSLEAVKTGRSSRESETFPKALA